MIRGVGKGAGSVEMEPSGEGSTRGGDGGEGRGGDGGGGEEGKYGGGDGEDDSASVVMFETTEGVVTLEIVPVLFVLTPNNRNEEGECPASVLELAAEVPEGLGFAFALSRTTSSSSICFVTKLSVINV